MATYYIVLPFDSSNSADNSSIGVNGSPAPSHSTEIAGINPEGNLTPVSVTDNGFVNVNASFGGTVDTDLAGLGTFQTSQYNIGTTEVQITPSPLANRSSVTLKVITTSGNQIFICNTSGSVLTQGYPLFNGDSLTMDLTTSGTIYAVATADGQNLYALEMA